MMSEISSKVDMQSALLVRNGQPEVARLIDFVGLKNTLPTEARTITMKIDFVEPWVAVGKYGDNLVKELQREVTQRHLLWNQKVCPIGQRTDTDDVLFELDGTVPSFAVVHLTWSGEPEQNPQWPETRLYSSLADWIKDGMTADHQEFIGSNE